MRVTLYEPLSVYKQLAPDIGIVDGPFEYFTVAGLRMPMLSKEIPLSGARRDTAG